ncbi:MAG: DUF721 domain-containing protein [Gemmataceae bacterium]|nr:DUF721 domain-containing protein [Gemmataceae bacterium]
MGIRYFKPDPGPEKVGSILGRLFIAKGWGRKQERLQLEKAWAEAAGEEYLAGTRVVVVKKGVLEIAVSNSSLLQELAQFQKRPLLTRLKELLPGVALTDLRFRLGKID